MAFSKCFEMLKKDWTMMIDAQEVSLQQVQEEVVQKSLEEVVVQKSLEQEK